MPRSLVLVLALAVGVQACASSPQQAQAPRPQPSRAPAAATTPAPTPAPAPATAAEAAGVYDYVALAQGQEVGGTINIVSRDGVHSGVITSSMLPDMAISGVTVAGSKITVSADSPNGVVVLEFTLTGQELAGTWSLGGDGGPLTGRKRGG